MSENFSSRLKEYLPQQLFYLLQDAGVKATELGQTLFLVGGVVRDLFLGRTNCDLDVVVEGDAIKLAQELAKSSQVKAILHHRFGTAKLRFADFSLDIATSRRESYKCPGTLPDVQPGSITDDLLRRDFSVNAMALYLTPERFGELIDPYLGQEDINDRLIRILHPNSFRDDATRIFRAIRYEQRLGFKIEQHTANLLRRNLNMIGTISGDRIRHELVLILMEAYPERVLRRAEELGVFAELHPSLKGNGRLSAQFEQARQLDKRSSVYSLYLCLLVYHLSAGENEQLMAQFNFPSKLAEATQQTLRLKAQLDCLTKPGIKPSDVYQLLHGYITQAVQANMLASQSEAIKQHLHLYLTKLRYMKPLLSGDDVSKLGVPSGPQCGDVLDILLGARLNGEVRTKQDEKNLVRGWLSNL